MTGRADAAADLAQATALRALEKSSLFEPGTRMDSWLFKMAHRVWLNELRREAVRRGQGLVPVEEAGLPSHDGDGEETFFRGEVLSSVLGLPEAQRSTVLLVYVEGYKYAEAAEILGIPIGTVMSRLASARAALAARIGETREESDVRDNRRRADRVS